jgi:hypothetical protein
MEARMSLTLFGEHPLATDASGKLISRIGTLFVPANVLITLPRMTHAMQRLFYRDQLNLLRRRENAPDLTDDEADAVWETAVDLIMDDRDILIRPEPNRMPLAFEADERLQQIASKRHIRFLHARDASVQQAIRERGEYWRISAQPQKEEEIIAAIARSRIAIGGQPIYYYSPATGTRYITAESFQSLAAMDTPDLRQHLIEIRDYAAKRNRYHHCEVAFFGASDAFTEKSLAGYAFETADSNQLRGWHTELAVQFLAAVDPALRVDAPNRPIWRNHMFATLTDERNDTLAETVVSDLTPEFFRQIHWFPGGRVEDGELIFDPIFDELNVRPDDKELSSLCDQRIKGFICNYIREFGGLQYVNIGGLMPGLRKRPARGGHRAYLAEIKHRGADKPTLRIIRIQRWGIREHLDEGKDLLWAVMEAHEYTDYTLDRRLGCWQLGMPLPVRMDTRSVSETYFTAEDPRYNGTRIWTTYFERDFINGLATEKIPDARLLDRPFAFRVAQLLGEAAVPNLVVGRTSDKGEVTFDSGDEMLMMDERGMPLKIVVADHAGTFNDYESPLEKFAEDYARPVLARKDKVSDIAAFAEKYLVAFQEKLVSMQTDYREKRRAFDSLFQHSKQGEKTFSWRWAKALARLDKTDAAALTEKIRRAISAGLRP